MSPSGAREVRGNPFGVAGIVVAAVAIVIGPLLGFRASLVLGVVAVILSGVGMYWWRLHGVGRLPSAAGLVVGAIASVLSLYFAWNGM